MYLPDGGGACVVTFCVAAGLGVVIFCVIGVVVGVIVVDTDL